MRWVLFCVLFTTGLLAYLPLMFIRKMNQVTAVLERIEANTRDLTNLMVR